MGIKDLIPRSNRDRAPLPERRAAQDPLAGFRR